MPEPASIAELCRHAQNVCRVTGLQPVQWRWSGAAWRQFKAEHEHMIMIACQDNPDLPPGCLGIYEGLPIYRMALPHPAVACVGARVLPPGF